MTLVEYGDLTVKLVHGKPEMLIICTLPDELLEKTSNIDNDMKLIVTNECKVFVDIPKEMFEI